MILAAEQSGALQPCQTLVEATSSGLLVGCPLILPEADKTQTCRDVHLRQRIEDTLLVAYSRMKRYDVSQLPGLRGQEIVGILDRIGPTGRTSR